MIRVKNHHMPPTIRVEAALGFKSDLFGVKRKSWFSCVQKNQYFVANIFGGVFLKSRFSANGFRIIDLPLYLGHSLDLKH